MRNPTSEEWQIAKENGINYQTVRSRLEREWPIERAITEPPRKSSLIDGYWETCQANGISKPRFYNRVYSGMSKEDASTKPLSNRGRKRVSED